MDSYNFHWYNLVHFKSFISQIDLPLNQNKTLMSTVLSSSGSKIRHIDNYFKLIAEAEQQLIYKLHLAVTNK